MWLLFRVDSDWVRIYCGYCCNRRKSQRKGSMLNQLMNIPISSLSSGGLVTSNSQVFPLTAIWVSLWHVDQVMSGIVELEAHLKNPQVMPVSMINPYVRINYIYSYCPDVMVNWWLENFLSHLSDNLILCAVLIYHRETWYRPFTLKRQKGENTSCSENEVSLVSKIG